MKKTYLTPQADILYLAMENSACIEASVTENEGFTPVPGVWDTPTI